MLNLDSEAIYNLLDRARQFQVKDDVSLVEMDDEMDSLKVHDDYDDGAIYQEAVAFINDLREDQQATLVALMYLGRGDYSEEEWSDAYNLAVGELSDHTGEYLLARPLVADDIERGLYLLGISNSEE